MNTKRFKGAEERKLFSAWLPAWVDAGIRILADQEHRKIGQQATIVLEKGLLACGFSEAQINKLKEESES